MVRQGCKSCACALLHAYQISCSSDDLEMAHSCQPGRTKAYNEDLRWRMVWQREVLGLKLKKVTNNLCVDLSTVHRITKLGQC